MIISASRRTDIPSFYSEWFMNRIREGSVLVRNPMNRQQVSRVDLSPDGVDCIVFWTKNPKPMLDRLDELGDYSFYFQFTLNSYGKDVEGGLPFKGKEIIDTFKRLSDKIGRERVIWRYDPIFLSDRYCSEYHVHYFERLAFQLKDYTEKCTISFIDIYSKIERNMLLLGMWSVSDEVKRELARDIATIALGYGLRVESCAEKIGLSDLGITRGRCIDDQLIERLINCPIDVKRDRGQRLECGCRVSIDIGAYNTCENGCKYCYANHSSASVRGNILNHDFGSPLLCGILTDEDKISERSLKSIRKSN